MQPNRTEYFLLASMLPQTGAVYLTTRRNIPTVHKLVAPCLRWHYYMQYKDFCKHMTPNNVEQICVGHTGVALFSVHLGHWSQRIWGAAEQGSIFEQCELCFKTAPILFSHTAWSHASSLKMEVLTFLPGVIWHHISSEIHRASNVSMVSMFNAAVIFVLGLSIPATQCFPMHSKLFNVLTLPLISHGRCFTILKFLDGHEIDDSHNIGIIPIIPMELILLSGRIKNQAQLEYIRPA